MKLIKSTLIFFVHFCLQISNMSLWGSLIFLFGLVRFALPIKAINNALLKLMHRFYFTFSLISVAMIRLFNPVEIEVNIDTKLSKKDWYLIICNHLSYLDIILLIEFCARHASPPKFFLKKELIWMPFVGIAAWALDMPFMRRYSQAFITKNPHLKGKDIETTRASCAKFVDQPTSVINFVEGTRFTPAKAAQKNSPFSHLMRPKAGGIAFTLAAMGEQFSHILDMTIAYPHNAKRPMVDMLSGNMQHIIIDVKVLELTSDVIGDYFEDTSFQVQFQSWLNTLWIRKNKLMQAWMGEH